MVWFILPVTPSGLFSGKCFAVFSFTSRLLPALLVVSLVGAGWAETDQPPHPTGLLPPTPEDKAWLEENAHWVTFPEKELKDLPSRVINLEHLPPVGNQRYGSCASWSVVYYMKGWQEAKEHGITRPFPEEHILSPHFVFRWVAIPGGALSGAAAGTRVDNFRFLERCGTTTFEEVPEDSGLPSPSVELWKSASRRRSAPDSLGRIPTDTPEGLQTLKAVLAGGELASAAVGVWRNFDEYPRSGEGVNNRVFFAEGTSGFRDNHAVTIIGYDDDITYHNGEEERQGAFLAVNSWGTSWGVAAEEGGEGGYVWLAYEYFLNNEGRAKGYDFKTMENRIGYEPEDFLVLDIFHPRKAELSMHLLAHHPDAGSEPRYTLLPPGGLRPLDAAIAIDVTDFVTDQHEAFWVLVLDLLLPQYGPRAQSVIRSVSMERKGRVPLTARENIPLEPLGQWGGQLVWEEIPISPTLRHEEIFPPHGLTSAEGGSPVRADIADIYGEDTTDIVALGELLRMEEGRPVPRGSVPPGRYGLGDYTNDGLPDLAVHAQFEDGTQGLRLFRNRGAGSFVEEHVLPGSYYWGVEPFWADFTGNGLLDLVLVSTTTISPSRVLVNRGGGVFRDDGIELPRAPGRVNMLVDFDQDGLMDFGGWRNLGNGEWEPPPWDERFPFAWGDYNGNGLMDAAVLERGRFAIYRNEGEGEFTRVLEEPYSFSMWDTLINWADVNNSGRMDIVLMGNPLSGHRVSTLSRKEVFLQEEDGTFRSTSLATNAASGGTMGVLLMADFDRDGDIDFLTGGYPSVPGTTFRADKPREVRYTESLWADADGLARPNEPPSPPANLRASAGGEAGSVTLRWDDARDDRTPGPAMRYQLRVGNTPGGHEVVSAGVSLASLPPSRLSPDQAGRHLAGLAAGTYYWSVRAMDGSGAFSPWPAEQQFTIHEGAKQKPLFDPNQDGVLDAADVAYLRGLVGSSAPENLRVGDIDGTGSITMNDVSELARILAGRAGTPTPPWIATVDRHGGVLERDGVQVTIPEGAIQGEPVLMRLEKERNTTRFGPSHEQYTPYHLTGIPLSLEKPIEVSIPNRRYSEPDFQEPLIVIGEEAMVPSLGETRLSYRVIEPDHADISNNYALRLYFQIEPIEEEIRKSLQKDEEFVEGRYSNNFWVLGGYSYYTTPNFRVAFPRAYDTEIVENLANDLEQAHARYRRDDMGFSYAARTRWPVSVTLKDLGATTYGYAYSSRRGHNHGGMEFNTQLMDDPEARRVTAFHEFFHIVEGFYDPRGAVRRGTTMSPHYTVSEMAATWAEEFAVSDPDSYVPEEWYAHRYVPFEPGGIDLPPAIQSDVLTRDPDKVAQHGYAWAPMIRYLAQKQGNTVVRDIFRNIRAGQDWILAIRYAAERPGFIWFHGFMLAYVMGEVYPLCYDDRKEAVAATRLYLGDGNTHREFTRNMSNLSAKLYGVNVSIPWRNQQRIKPEHRLGFRLEGPVGSRLSIISDVEGEEPEVVEIVHWEDGLSRHVTGSVHPVLSEPESAYYALTTFDRFSPRHEEPEEFRLLMSLIEDETLDVEPVLRDEIWPPFRNDGGTISVPASSGDFEVTILSPPSFGTVCPGNMFRGSVWEDEEAEFQVSVTGTFLETVQERPGGGRNEVTVDGYELRLVKDGGFFGEGEAVWETFSSEDGTFEFMPHIVGGHMEWGVWLKYTYRQYHGGDEAVSTHHREHRLVWFQAEVL